MTNDRGRGEGGEPFESFMSITLDPMDYGHRSSMEDFK